MKRDSRFARRFALLTMLAHQHLACSGITTPRESLEDSAGVSSPSDRGPLATNLSGLFSASANAVLDSFRPPNQKVMATSGCNSVAFAQIDAGSTLFFGRELNSGTCEGGQWSLTISSLVNGTQLVRHARILDTSTPGGLAVPGTDFRITTAYDPSTVVFDGERWVVFECHDPGFGPLAATCGGPVHVSAESPSSSAVDLSRLSVLVDLGRRWG